MKLGPFEVPGYYVGDCRELLRRLPCDSINCCVTSPPYWSLRDYGVPPVIWGGDPACAHGWGPEIRRHRGGPAGESGVMLQGGRSVVEAQADVKDVRSGAYCQACGGWRGQLGLEPTPGEFVDHLVEVFREVHRVLRPEATAWVNIGDSYAAGGNGGGGSFMSMREHNGWGYRADKKGWRSPPAGLKPKDLCLVPQRLALALQADGWWVRSIVVWNKPNPMPEAVTDRPTGAHEYVLLLAKSERYFYNADAIKEPVSGTSKPRGKGRNPKSVAGKNEQSVDARKVGFNERWRTKQNESFSGAVAGIVETRNKRSVWTIPTEPTVDYHFAAFPKKLVEPCILAGSPYGGVVLDPFGGSGTVGKVADDLGRRWILFDLSQPYAEIAKRKTAQAGLVPLEPPTPRKNRCTVTTLDPEGNPIAP